MRAWCPDDEATRLLRLLSEDRRRFVAERTAYKNQLRQRLKEFSPLALELAGPRLEKDSFLRLLLKFPSHAELHRASPRALARLLPKLRRVPDDQETDPRVTKIREAIPLVTYRAIVKAGGSQ